VLLALEEAVGSRQRPVAEAAAFSLARIAPNPGTLARALSDNRVAWGLAALLAQGDQLEARALVEVLAHLEGKSLPAAVRALGALGVAEEWIAEPLTVAALNSDPDLMVEVLRALPRVCPLDRALPHLETGLGHGQPAVRVAALAAARAYGPEGLAAVRSALGDVWAALAAEDPSKKDEALGLAMVAAWQELMPHDDSVVALLLETLRDHPDSLGNISMVTLGKADPPVTEQVIEMARAVDPANRSTYVFALGTFGEGALPVLLDPAWVEERVTWRAVSEAIGFTGECSPEAAAWLETALGEPWVRAGALRSIQRLGPKAKALQKPVLKLWKKLDDPQEQYDWLAAAGACAPDAKGFLDVAVEMLETSRVPAMRARAALVLGTGERSVSRRRKALLASIERGGVYEVPKNASPMELLQALEQRSESENVMIGAFTALERLDSPNSEVLDMFRGMVERGDKVWAVFAAKALASFGKRASKAGRDLAVRLHDPSRLIQAACVVGLEGVKPTGARVAALVGLYLLKADADAGRPVLGILRAMGDDARVALPMVAHRALVPTRSVVGWGEIFGEDEQSPFLGWRPIVIDPDELRIGAIELLVEMALRQPEDVSLVRGVLERLSTDPRGGVRDAALDALTRLGN
jgi:hypothetical protein